MEKLGFKDLTPTGTTTWQALAKSFVKYFTHPVNPKKSSGKQELTHSPT